MTGFRGTRGVTWTRRGGIAAYVVVVAFSMAGALVAPALSASIVWCVLALSTVLGWRPRLSFLVVVVAHTALAVRLLDTDWYHGLWARHPDFRLILWVGASLLPLGLLLSVGRRFTTSRRVSAPLREGRPSRRTLVL